MNMDEKKIHKQLMDIWLENMKAILKEMRGKDIDRMLALSNKNLMQFQMMNQWVKVKQKRNNLSGYFKENGYNRIAIYGMGVAGETLLDELQETNIEVVYGIDRNAHMMYSKIDVLSPENVLPEVDAIVVSIVESFDSIVRNLRGKIDCPIISLRDVVYDI